LASVSVLGLGAMGSRMARRLLDAGNDLTVWNRSPHKADPILQAGARVASTPAEAAMAGDVLVTMVSDPGALDAVMSGEHGVLSGIRPGALLLEMSTVGPQAVLDLAHRLPDGVRMLDAPVLGSLSEVEAGSLRIFVGGEDEDLARAEPVLRVLGEPLHVGPLGSGAAAKLVANSTLLGVLCLLGEGVALGEALGLERDSVFEVLAGTPLAQQAERRRPALEGGKFERRFALGLAEKDGGLVTDAARTEALELGMAKAAQEYFEQATEAGWADLDYSAILAFITDRPKP
jgi:3-hydroxyisobutyrate dehydrogenase/2-hydroxy-3-oxopropionate reductase